jgi:soluble lytic murein transglycosylase-like protein
MRRIQAAILPGLLGGILCLVGVAMFLLPSPEWNDPATNVQQSNGCSTNLKIPAKVRGWCEWIDEYGAKWQLDPLLIAAIIQLESGGDPAAISKNGAVGLMQVMPGDGKALAFQCVAGPCFSDRPSTGVLLNPEYNISYGTELLSYLLSESGTLRDALRSYGPIDVGYEYADQVLEIRERFK